MVGIQWVSLKNIQDELRVTLGICTIKKKRKKIQVIFIEHFWLIGRERNSEVFRK